jgi:hypothetical protein
MKTIEELMQNALLSVEILRNKILLDKFPNITESILATDCANNILNVVGTFIIDDIATFDKQQVVVFKLNNTYRTVYFKIPDISLDQVDISQKAQELIIDKIKDQLIYILLSKPF